jgi:tetratricopeptide (TPR) repeat protein
MTTLIVAFVAFGGFMGYRSSHSGKSAGEYARMAAGYADAGDYSKAAEFYGRSLEKDPDGAEALLGMFAALAAFGDADAAKPYAEQLLASRALTAEHFPGFADQCAALGDARLTADAYAKWLSLAPDQSARLLDRAKAHVSEREWDAALEIAKCFLDSGRGAVASVLLDQIAEEAAGQALPPGRLLPICELWASADPASEDAQLALAGASAGAGLADEAAELYSGVIARNPKSAEAYDGLLAIYYKNDALKTRFGVLEAAARNIGSKKYRDMLESTRQKLSDYYSTVRLDGAVYHDGIYRITLLDRDGNEITPISGAGGPADAPDGTGFLIEYYDTLGNEREMKLDSRQISAVIDDIDFDGSREVVVKKYAADELVGSVSDDTVKSAAWYDIYRVDRSTNKLIYASQDYPAYYGGEYASQARGKLAQFERLQEAMEGHYGVAYGLLYALRQAALDFAGGEWAPESTGEALGERLKAALITPDLQTYVRHKGAGYGKLDGDTLAGGDFRSEAPGSLRPGMAESEVAAAFGEPRHIIEEEFDGLAPDGTPRTYLNRILEYPFMNFYTSDGAVKAFRINSRDIEGPRFLRIGDTVYDIINKFPSMYFDDVASYAAQKADADIEFSDPETGVTLSYTIKNGAIADIELFLRDAGGDWRPGTNTETLPAGGDWRAAAENQAGAESAAGDGAVGAGTAGAAGAAAGTPAGGEAPAGAETPAVGETGAAGAEGAAAAGAEAAAGAATADNSASVETGAAAAGTPAGAEAPAGAETSAGGGSAPASNASASAGGESAPAGNGSAPASGAGAAEAGQAEIGAGGPATAENPAGAATSAGAANPAGNEAGAAAAEGPAPAGTSTAAGTSPGAVAVG